MRLSTTIASLVTLSSLGWILSSAQGSTIIIPVTGTTLTPGIAISILTTTGEGNGIPTIAVLPSGTYDSVSINFGVPVPSSVPDAFFASQAVFRDGSSFRSADPVAIGQIQSAFSTTTATTFTMFTFWSDLPLGNTVRSISFTQVPETSTTVLISVGMLSVIARRRRNKKL